MGNAIYATSALALAGAMAAGPASAADMLSMGIGGYMEQWVGMSSTDDAGNKMNDGGMGQKSDSEIYITGSLESDSGLKFAVKFELEGQNNADGTANNIDEARMTIGGSFGEIWLGGDDVASTAMHAGVPDVGIGLGDGDVGKWIVGAANGLSTVGPDLHSDYGHIAYYTPRLSGVQLGVSFVPDVDANQVTAGRATTGQEESRWSAGLNFVGDLGGSSVKFSLGHTQTEQESMPLMATGDTEVGLDDYRGTTGGKMADAFAAGDLTTMMKGDDATVSNVGLGVGFGAFGFNVAYAAIDGGIYETMRYAEYTGDANNQNDQPDMLSATELAASSDSDTGVTTDSDYAVMQKVVKDKSKDYNVVAVGALYTDGPMAVSLSHMIADYDNGTDSSASMLSASYTLAPGVAWKSSLFTADDNTEGKGHEVEGNGFVTGVKINF